MNTYETLAGEVLFAGKNGILRKLVCSKPAGEGILRATGRVCRVRGALCLQLETLHTDGKATHENLPLDGGFPAALAEKLAVYSQVNLLTDAGDAELRRGKKGNTVLLGAEKLHKSRAIPAPGGRIGGNDKEKKRILTGGEPFLRLLGVSDENGRVYDMIRKAQNSARSTAFWNWSAIPCRTCPKRKSAFAISVAAKVTFRLPCTTILPMCWAMKCR